jgi:hypothetical protein
VQMKRSPEVFSGDFCSLKVEIAGIEPNSQYTL